MAYESINHGVLAKIDRNLSFDGTRLHWRNAGRGDTRGNGASVMVSVVDALENGAKALGRYGYTQVDGSYQHGTGYDASVEMRRMTALESAGWRTQKI